MVVEDGQRDRGLVAHVVVLLRGRWATRILVAPWSVVVRCSPSSLRMPQTERSRSRARMPAATRASSTPPPWPGSRRTASGVLPAGAVSSQSTESSRERSSGASSAAAPLGSSIATAEDSSADSSTAILSQVRSWLRASASRSSSPSTRARSPSSSSSGTGVRTCSRSSSMRASTCENSSSAAWTVPSARLRSSVRRTYWSSEVSTTTHTAAGATARRTLLTARAAPPSPRSAWPTRPSAVSPTRTTRARNERESGWKVISAITPAPTPTQTDG
ncbi:hypothetical protein C5C99_03510 [Rathayibacter sp. AY1C4]|nr:hypothetical protein C5C99_03510 [Rathayibacter sp. AY1C4]